MYSRAWFGVDLIQHFLGNEFILTLHYKGLAVGAFWGSKPEKSEKQTFRLAVARKRRPWFEGLWASAGESVNLVGLALNPNNPLGGTSCLHDAWRRDLRPFCPSVRRP